MGLVLFSLMSILELKYFTISVEDLSPYMCWKETIAISNLLSVNKITLSPLSPGAMLSLFLDNSCYSFLSFPPFCPVFLKM